MNPITLEIMKNRFFAITEEMGAALVRTAYSTNIKDRKDCSCALFTPDGRLISQAEHIPLHLGVLPWAVRGALDVIPPDELRPGDAIMHNDPFIGGTHLPDIIIFAPVFFQDELVAIVGNLAHHIDIGGGAPNMPQSLPPTATEIFQEGIRFPPVKIRKEGVIDEEIMRIHDYNVRTVHETRGDLLSQLAANNVGEGRFQKLCQDMGVDFVKEAILQLEEYCGNRMSNGIFLIPDGTYCFSDVLEGDGHSGDPIEMKVKIVVKGDSILLDWTGTSPQTKGPVNAVRPMTLASIYYVLKAIVDPGIPPNHGSYDSIEVITPPGTLVNATFPAPTGGGNSLTCQRMVDVLLGAFYQAVPQKVCAAGTGSMNSISLSGKDGKKKTYVHVETYGGGYGATHSFDGESGVHTHMTNTANAPVEVIESTLPVVVTKYSLVEDSEGPGKHRGGFGICREFYMNREEVFIRICTDRVNKGPWGLEGGLKARGTRLKVTLPDGQEESPPSKGGVTLKPGSIFRIETSGGGGWGDPEERDVLSLQQDLEEGLISPARAREVYGRKSK